MSRIACGHASAIVMLTVRDKTREEGWTWKINDRSRTRERLNVRPMSINIDAGPRRRFSRLSMFCTRPAKISVRQYRTMLDCRHYGGHCRGFDMSPVASGIQAAISWRTLPLASPRVSPFHESWTAWIGRLEKRGPVSVVDHTVATCELSEIVA